MLYPLKFKPVYKDYIWGGRNLEKLNKKLPEGNIAESWEISCHKDGMSIVENGELAGRTLEEIIKSYGDKILGRSIKKRFQDKFPLLIKLIDANKDLSVQVHPNDDYAKSYENKVEGFSPEYFMYFEDVDLCYKINKIGKKVLYYPEARMIHLHNQESTKRINKLTFIHLNSMIKFYKKANI